MTNKKFVLSADISTEDPLAIQQILTKLVGVDAIIVIEKGFKVRTTMQGNNARDLNRTFLSALRRAEKKTTLRAEWTHDKTTERFFDYVPKRIREC